MFDLIVLLCRYLFIFYIGYFLWQGIVYIFANREINFGSGKRAMSKQKVTIIFMHVTAYLILSYVPGTFLFDKNTLMMGTAGFLLIIYIYIIAEKLFKNSCPLIWNLTVFLIDLGLIMLQRLDNTLVIKQLIWIAAGFTIIIFIPFVMRLIKDFTKLEYLYIIFAFVLIALPYFFGKAAYGSNNWVSIFGFSFQPSELVKFLSVFYLASAFSKEFTSFKQVIISGVLMALLILNLVYQKDLGGSLIFFITFMIMMFVATGSYLLFISGMAAITMAAFIAYKLFAHIRVRVLAWQNPWADIDTGGYQIVQGFFAMGTWGLLGAGLTRGYPKYVPVVERDFIFAAICEEFGIIFGFGVIIVFIMILLQGFITAVRCKTRFYALLSTGFTSLLIFQAFLIIGGVTKFIPLTGVTLPFVCYGGSSMLICIITVALIQCIYIFNRETEAEEEQDGYKE